MGSLPLFRRQRCEDDLVRVRGRAHFGDNHVIVETSFYAFRLTLDANQAVLFAVIQPVVGSADANDALQLIGLHPDDLTAALVALEFMHSRPTERSDHHHLKHLVIAQQAVRQFHVNVPNRP